MPKHTIHLPKDYHTLDLPASSDVAGSYCLYVELETFRKYWDLAKQKGIRKKVIAEAGISRASISFAFYRANYKKLYKCDRIRFQNFINKYLEMAA